MTIEAEVTLPTITPTGESCGAIVTGIDLSRPLHPDIVATLRDAWITYGLLILPNQKLDDDDLERFTLAFGPFGDDPFVAPIPGREHIIAIRRRADETAPIFAENWHTDWSFQENPPAGTCLYGITVPPIGGDTQFANQQLALERMPAGLRARLEGVSAVHSAQRAYAPKGTYGAMDKGRSMDIRGSDDALATQRHLVIRPHPETGRLGLFGCAGYIMHLEGDDDGSLLRELHAWQTRNEFVYSHKWEPDMLIMWDNRIVLHRATGGYDGYDRLLHRTTVGAR